MKNKDNFSSQYDDSLFLYRGKRLNCKFYRENNLNFPTNKPLLEVVKSPVKTSKNTSKSEYKGVCLLIGLLALLSIGMCIQADSLAQALREVARITVQQTIRIHHR
ncbi:hypothetical protein H6G64_27620 [Calothrix sp. FACHB-156]|nr:hypothetical protein [Calothrix membranacea FACHB-236]MBD2340741.1 hypothetical protein [Calothrix sp. FACHB-156]